MNPAKPFVIFSILAIYALSACCEKDEFSPYLEGDIIGYAYCYDEYGNNLDDFSGIKVVTEPDREYSALTDKNGRYVLKNVINGTYNLSFEKEGFGTMKMFGIQHLGGKPTIISYYYDNDFVVIYEYITTHINSIQYQNDTLIANLTFQGAYRPMVVMMQLFFSTNPSFDLQTAQSSISIQLWGSENIYRYYGDVSAGLPFISGETVYCKAAIYSESNYISDSGRYYDPETKTIVFPNISDEISEFSFTMP